MQAHLSTGTAGLCPAHKVGVPSLGGEQAHGCHPRVDPAKSRLKSPGCQHKCRLISAIFLSNLRTHAARSQESGCENSMIPAENPCFSGSSVYKRETSDAGFGARQLSCGVHFLAVICHSEGKNCPIPLNLPPYPARTSGMR